MYIQVELLIIYNVLEGAGVNYVCEHLIIFLTPKARQSVLMSAHTT